MASANAGSAGTAQRRTRNPRLLATLCLLFTDSLPRGTSGTQVARAVHVEDRTGRPLRAIRREEQHGCRDLLRPAHPPGRALRPHSVATWTVEDARGHVRLYEPRQ